VRDESHGLCRVGPIVPSRSPVFRNNFHSITHKEWENIPYTHCSSAPAQTPVQQALSLDPCPATPKPTRPPARGGVSVAKWLTVGSVVAVSLSGLSHDALLLIVVAPLLEEIVFRGGIQEPLLRRLSPSRGAAPWVVNVVTAIAFAAAHALTHLSFVSVLTVLPALAIGWLYQRTRRLAPCIALHAFFNAVWLFGVGGFA
jgi:Type II CAAX prenyl endopeptidase Rce1-like